MIPAETDPTPGRNIGFLSKRHSFGRFFYAIHGACGTSHTFSSYNTKKPK
mgnify:CR=1